MAYDKTKPSINLAADEQNKARERYAAEKTAKAAQEAVDAAAAEQKTYEAQPKTNRD